MAPKSKTAWDHIMGEPSAPVTLAPPKKARTKKQAAPPLPPPRDDRDVQQKIAAGVYRSVMPYPDRKDPDFKEKRAAYFADCRRLEEMFKRDLFDEHSVVGNPKAQRCFEIAYEHGHSNGFSEVAGYFSEFVELIQ
jgi:hypothetical protein